MFGPRGIPALMKMREQAKSAPRRDVSEAEFRAALAAIGLDERQVNMQVTVAKAMKGEVLVGGEMLTLVEAAAPKEEPAGSGEEEEQSERWDSCS